MIRVETDKAEKDRVSFDRVELFFGDSFFTKIPFEIPS